MPFTSDEPAVHTLDETQLAGYRGVSVLALVALVFAGASALALAHPLLWVVPPVAAVLAILALRQINAEGSNVTGRGIALLALFLALVFGVWAPSRLLSRQWTLYAQARVFADQWLALFKEGKREELHQLTLREVERQDPGADLKKFYAESLVGGDALRRMFNTRPPKTLIELGDRATYEYVGGEFVPPPENHRQSVWLAYRVKYEEQGQTRVLPLWIELQRERVANTNDYLWHVQSLTDTLQISE